MHTIALICLLVYTLLLFVIVYFTAQKANNETYFIGNRKSPWFVVAYGMIGSSLSGVTLLSVPGDVFKTQFTYYGIVLGYLIGYIIIALVLLPLYYKLNLTSIYSYLGNRFGKYSHKTGSFFFILSRLFGSALRMYLVIFVLQEFVFSYYNIPIWITAISFIIIILLYTFRGGIKTIVWTDTLQTTFLLAALVLTIVFIVNDMGVNLNTIWHNIDTAGYTKMFNTNWQDNKFFVKQIISGIFITITMTGLDQDMMQKNLSCKTLKDAQQNMFVFSIILLIVNALFLFLGGLLCVYATQKGVDISSMLTDKIYPTIAFELLPPIAGIVFIIGLIAAGYSSADGTLTSLTTVVCVDFLKIDSSKKTEQEQIQTRRITHIVISLFFLAIILIFAKFHNKALIDSVFSIASYTYGPLLGLFSFGLFTKRRLKFEYLTPFIAILSPIICWFLSNYSENLFAGYKFGFELLLINGFLTFIGLLLISQSGKDNNITSSNNL